MPDPILDFKPPKRRVRGRLERLARARAREDRERLPRLGYRFNPDLARHVTDFFARYLRHTEAEWAGQPFRLAEWQRFIKREVFGWLRPDGTRRFRTAYVEVARKNGKSTDMAGNGLYLTAADREPKAQVYSTATKLDQARIVHGMGKDMLRLSPLNRVMEQLKDNISFEPLGSYFRPLGADSKTLDGLNAHGHLVDELHAHRDRTVFDVVNTSMGARRQPLVLIITTAGIYDPNSIGWKTHEYARQVLEGTIQDESFFAFIATADKDDDWRDPRTWWKANPNLGKAVKWEYMNEMCLKAQRQPSFLNTFLRDHLDIWTQQVTRWIPPEAWKACPKGPIEEDLEGREAYAGLDLSSKKDITALVLALPDPDSPAIDLICRFWIPEDTAQERTEKEGVPYLQWMSDGWLIGTPGNVIDYDWIIHEVMSLAKRYRIEQLRYDPWNATQTAIKLQEEGLEVVEMRQGYASMSEPCKEMEVLVMNGTLRHGHHPVLTWMANNVAVTEDPAGNIKMAKDKSKEKIDGMVAAAMALAAALVPGEQKAKPLIWSFSDVEEEELWQCGCNWWNLSEISKCESCGGDKPEPEGTPA